MSKIKLDDRLKRAIKAFFDPEPNRSNFELTYAVGEQLVEPRTLIATEKGHRKVKILREILLFGPGAIALFYVTLAILFFYPEGGVSFQGGFMLAAAAFLTYAGAGNLKDIKNLAVPGTVIVLAVLVALVSSLFPNDRQTDNYFWYSIYLFPNVLISAKLVQMWVSDDK